VMIVTLAVAVGLTGGARAAPPEQNPHAALRGDNAEEHACVEPAGQRAEALHCFTSLGPNRFAGRVRALVVRPDDRDTIWAATASGGLWVTHDAGSNWSRGGDITRTLVFSSLALDPLNPDVMYAGSGEIHTTLHRINSDNFQAGDDAGLSLRTPRRGFGIFKTTDGGAHWSELSQTTLNKNFFYVSRIAVNQDNSNRVLAATATGLWRTSDGGATWTRAVCVPVVNGVPFRIPCAGIFLDVKFHSHDSSNAVASGFGGTVWFSTDSGFSFNASTLPTSVPAGASANDSKRVELAFVRSQPGVWLAAQIFANGNSSPIVLLRSIDNGATFSVRSDADGIGCFNNRLYSGALFISDFGTHVFVGGVQLCHSSDGGRTFTRVTEGDQMHNDYHAIVRGDLDDLGNGTIVIGNDGGAYRILDPTRLNPFTWFFDSAVLSLNNGLVNQQAHGAAFNPISGEIIAGLQDIGSARRATDGTWTFFSCCDGVGGSDGTTTATDPTDGDLFYFGNNEARLFRSTLFGGSESIVSAATNPTDDPCLGATPILLDPDNANTLYVGCARLWRTKNVKTSNAADITWSDIKAADSESSYVISAMTVAPWDHDVMWVGTVDMHPGSASPKIGKGGKLWMTTELHAFSRTDLLASWQPVTDPILPLRPVSGVALHPTDQSRVYVSFSGWVSTDFTNTSNNLFRGIKGTDGQFHFSDISAKLPGGPVYSVALSPSGGIAAGTEFGVRISSDDGATWSLAGPRVAVARATWLDEHHVLVASYGRGVFILTV
jgi:hypothetical protein